MSLSQLPGEMLDMIVHTLRSNVQNDSHMVDLRLVSKAFNEAVLYALCSRTDLHSRVAEQKHKLDCMWCLLQPQWLGSSPCPTAYTRMYLQAGLAVSPNSRLPVQPWQTLMRSAHTQLKDMLSQPQFHATMKSIENDPRFDTSLSAEIFTDQVGLLLCNTIITTFESLDPFFHNIKKHKATGHVHGTPTSFWILTAAYYLGDLDFLKSLLENHPFMEQLTHSGFGSLTKCLRVAIREGHKHVVEFVIKVYLKNAYYNYVAVLREALLAGQTDIVNMLLPLVPETIINSICYQTLDLSDGEWSRVPSNLPAFEILYNRTDNIPFHVTGRILLQQAERGAVDILKFVLNKNKGQLQTLFRYLRSQNDQIWKAASTTDIECQLILVQHQFFASHSSRAFIFSRCRDAITESIRRDRIDIARAFTGYLEEDQGFSYRNDDDLIAAAGAKGGLDLLMTKSERDYHVYRECKSIAQPVLRNAIRNLQPENVRFLLRKGAGGWKDAGMRSELVPWLYRRTREARYQAVQELLREYSMPLMVTVI